MTGSGTGTRKEGPKILAASSKIIRLMEENDRHIYVLVDTIVGEGTKAVLAVVCGENAEDFFNHVKKSKAFKARKTK